MRSIFRPSTWFIAVSLFSTLLGCAAVEVNSKPGTTTTVILIRHADRDEYSDELNAKGRERAMALTDAVSDRDITAIYSPNVERNLDTARPLASRLVLWFINSATYSVTPPEAGRAERHPASSAGP